MADGLRVVSSSPLCAEAPLEQLDRLLTPNSLFFVRDHFPRPEQWPGLAIEGATGGPRRLQLADLARLRPRSLAVTLECAGNGRSLLSPAVPGEPWGLGAVSTASWEGCQLSDLLEEAGIPERTLEVVFHGADGYARSLPVAVTMNPETLLVTGMNGTPLTAEHGGPLRLLVPSWYSMASVKWLERIELVEEPFQGRFQVESYVIEGRPVREMEVRALITRPAAGTEVRGPARVTGFAWTGRGSVARVEISDDAGVRWQPARIVEEAGPYAWVRWEADWTPRAVGQVTLLARASDSTGRVQPMAARWNSGGYCNNQVAPHEVVVVQAAGG